MTERTEVDKFRHIIRSMEDDYEIFKLRKRGVINRLPVNYWDKSTARNVIRAEIREHLLSILKSDKQPVTEKIIFELTRKTLCTMNYRNFFKERKMTCALEQFSSMPYEMVTYCYPEMKIMPWELNSTPDAYWNDDTIAKAMQWVLEKVGLQTRKEICENLTCNVLRENGLKTLFDLKTLHELVSLAVPNMKIMPWELKKMHSWDCETAAMAIRWLIEDILKWSYYEVCENISTKVFEDNGLGGMLTHCCHHSTFEALELAYPGKYAKESIKGYTQKMTTYRLGVI